MRSAIAFIATVVGLSSTAAAQVCEHSVALRVNERGLDFVTQLVRPMIPTSVAIPAVDQAVLDWPLTDDDARVQLAGLNATLEVKELHAYMDGGAVYLQGKASVSAHGPVKVLYPYAGFGSADCQAAVDLIDLTIKIGARLESDSGHTRIEVTSAKIGFNEQSKVALEGCTLGTVLTAVVDFIRAHFMGSVQTAAESLAKQKIPALLESKLDGALQLSGKADDLGLGYLVNLEALDTDETGIAARIGGSLTLATTEVPACLAGADLTPPAACVGVTPQLQPQQDAMFAAGVSQALLQQALHSLWRSGRLCIDSSKMNGVLPGGSLDKLATALGLPAGSQIDFNVRFGAAPEVRFSAKAGATLALRGLRVEVGFQLPGGKSGRVGMTGDVAVSAAPWVDAASNGVALDLRSVEISQLKLLGEDGDALGLDPARMQRFVSEVAVPMLQKKLDGIQLTPAVVNGLGLFLVAMKQLQISDGFVAAYLDAILVDTSAKDAIPPETLLTSAPGPLVGPQVVRILVGGTDDQTPTGLLRYQHRVDGGEWSEPTYSRRVDVVAAKGAHHVEVAAVDLKGNVDPTPLSVNLTVDDVPPGLEVTTPPPPLLEGSTIEVSFLGSDDQTPSERLSFQAELYRVPDGGGEPQAVGLLAFRQGAGNARFDGLADGVYKVRVIARDEAGNVTSQDFGFSVDLQTGCTAAPGRPGGRLPLLPPALLGLALLALLCARRGSAVVAWRPRWKR